MAPAEEDPSDAVSQFSRTKVDQNEPSEFRKQWQSKPEEPLPTVTAAADATVPVMAESKEKITESTQAEEPISESEAGQKAAELIAKAQQPSKDIQPSEAPEMPNPSTGSSLSKDNTIKSQTSKA